MKSKRGVENIRFYLRLTALCFNEFSLPAVGYGHIDTLAAAVAEGAKGVDGVEVTVKRVPETMPEEAFKNAGGKQDFTTQEATPQELADYDAIIFGTPTRFGNMAGQMRTFLDQTGGLWAKGALRGKVASVFTSTGTARRWPVAMAPASRMTAS